MYSIPWPLSLEATIAKYRKHRLEQPLFNWNDLILVLTAFECFAASFVIFSLHRPIPPILTSLGLVLACYGGIALNEVILWGATFRQLILESSVNIFFTLSFTYVCAGPLLWLLATRLTQKKIVKSYLVIHFTPAVLVLMYFWLTFWSFSTVEKVSLIEHYQFDNSWHYTWVEFTSGLQRGLYSISAIYLMWPLLKTSVKPIHFADKEGKIFLSALGAVVFMELLFTTLKLWSVSVSTPFDWLGGAGVIINYANFFLINLFLYTWLKPLFNRVSFPAPKKQALTVNQEHIDKIEDGIHQQMLYLNPNLTVERFATATDLLPKELSNAINRHYGVSFIEFINQYRIEEAKKRLEDPTNKHRTITDLFYQAGFNSKSVFNKLFRKNYHCTPSEYRKTAQQK